MSYLGNVWTDLKNLLRDEDALVSAATGGDPDQTVSDRVAIDAKVKREGWACVFCRFLDLFCQRGHCDAMLAKPALPSPWYVYPRAAICFSVIGVVPWALIARDWRIGAAWVLAMLLNFLWGVVAKV